MNSDPAEELAFLSYHSGLEASREGHQEGLLTTR